MDMIMMLAEGGEVRTEEGWKSLFEAAGLKYLRRISVRATTSILENSIAQ